MLCGLARVVDRQTWIELRAGKALVVFGEFVLGLRMPLRRSFAVAIEGEALVDRHTLSVAVPHSELVLRIGSDARSTQSLDEVIQEIERAAGRSDRGRSA